MGEMSPRRRAIYCYTGNREKADRITAHDPLTTATVEQMLAVKAPFPDSTRDVELGVRLAEAAWTIIGLEGFKIPFDLCIEAQALGAELNWGRIDRQPSVATHPFKDLKDLKIPEDLMERGRFPYKHGVVAKLREKYDYLPITNQVTGPFTLAGHAFGVEKFLIWTKKRKQEEILEALMMLADVNLMDAKEAAHAGADFICIADPTATADIISPQFFRDVMVPVYRYFSERCPLPIILHICGNASCFLPYLPDTGIDTFSADTHTDVGFAKQVLGKKVAVAGNVFTINLLMKTPKEVRDEAVECIKKGTDALIPSCGIPPRTPTENFRVLPEVAKCMVFY